MTQLSIKQASVDGWLRVVQRRGATKPLRHPVLIECFDKHGNTEILLAIAWDASDPECPVAALEEALDGCASIRWPNLDKITKVLGPWKT